MQCDSWLFDKTLKAIYRDMIKDYEEKYTDMTLSHFEGIQHEMQHKKIISLDFLDLSNGVDGSRTHYQYPETLEFTIFLLFNLLFDPNLTPIPIKNCVISKL